MASKEDVVTVELQDQYYLDSIGKLVFAYAGILIATVIVLGISVYLYLQKPAPVTFPVGAEMRVQPPIPVTQPYLTTPDLLQWVATILPKAFVYDFNFYNDQMNAAKVNFTTTGWAAFANQLNTFANYNTVQAKKMFVTAKPTASPYVLREGLIQESGKYGWWVQIPLLIKYDGFQPDPEKNVIFQVLVVRVPTTNNLGGVAIDNIIQAPETTGQS